MSFFVFLFPSSRKLFGGGSGAACACAICAVPLTCNEDPIYDGLIVEILAQAAPKTSLLLVEPDGSWESPGGAFGASLPVDAFCGVTSRQEFLLFLSRTAKQFIRTQNARCLFIRECKIVLG